MFKFSEFIFERNVDPVELGVRTSKIYGKRRSFGKWEKVVPGGHIPLSGYDRKHAESAAGRLDKVQQYLGMWSSDKPVRDAGFQVYNDAHVSDVMRIVDLLPTQPFVRTEDSSKLHSKIVDKSPTHIHVVTHKGVHYIADGHHSVMAAKLRGDDVVPVRRIDLDQFPKRITK